MKREIFTFGSNLGGRHGGGAAADAVEHHGAIWGQAEGLQGDSYAIPTCDDNIRPLPLAQIEQAVIRFKAFAALHPKLKFQVTKIGCGIAGFRERQIAPMFLHSPQNCELPEGWRGMVEA